MKSLLTFMIAFSAQACGHGPKIPILIYSVNRLDFEGKDEAQKDLVISGKSKDADKLICTTPNGEDILLQWMKRNCQ